MHVSRLGSHADHDSREGLRSPSVSLASVSRLSSFCASGSCAFCEGRQRRPSRSVGLTLSVVILF